MMKIKTLVLAGVLTASGLAQSGCALFLIGAGVAVGAGTVAYVNGELKAADEVSLNRGWSATQRAMEDLEFRVISLQKDALAGKLVARRADDTKITIRLTKQSDAVTEFRIRVGTFGDEDLSRLIYQKIKSRL